MHSTWSEMVVEFGDVIYSAAFRILRNEHDVEDVVQETFLEAWQQRDRALVTNWGGWLRTIVVRRALDRLRKRNTLNRASFAFEQLESPPSTDALIEMERAQALKLAIVALPSQQREIFCLRYFEYMPNHEIADVLGISQSAVSTALNKSKITLVAHLQAFCYGEKQ